jgi:3-oxoadipate enol-lactonase
VPFANLSGIRIHYESLGEGDPVLPINGLSAPSANWLFQVKELSPHFRVITFDNRGVGESDLPEAPSYPIAQMADDAAAVLEHLDIRRAHVVGHSMGGWTSSSTTQASRAWRPQRACPRPTTATPSTST